MGVGSIILSVLGLKRTVEERCLRDARREVDSALKIRVAIKRLKARGYDLKLLKKIVPRVIREKYDGMIAQARSVQDAQREKNLIRVKARTLKESSGSLR